MIRTMQAADLDFAAACTRDERWLSETREIFAWSWGFDPDGCLVAEAHDGPAGICVATSYGATGFIGELIVLPRHRGRGLGRRLLDRAIDDLTRRGAGAIFLDGVPQAVRLYERAGFRKVCRSLRFSGALPVAWPGTPTPSAIPSAARPGSWPDSPPRSTSGASTPDVRAATRADLPAIAALDREVFGADRGYFLEQRLAAHADSCRVRVRGGRIVGYVLGRRWDEGCQAGPWIQEPGLEEPERLPLSLTDVAGTRSLVMGVLESNALAADLVRRLPLQERQDPPWRMVRGPWRPGPREAWQITIGSPAKG